MRVEHDLDNFQIETKRDGVIPCNGCWLGSVYYCAQWSPD